jgi:hypothetical protein
MLPKQCAVTPILQQLATDPALALAVIEHELHHIKHTTLDGAHVEPTSVPKLQHAAPPLQNLALPFHRIRGYDVPNALLMDEKYVAPQFKGRPLQDEILRSQQTTFTSPPPDCLDKRQVPLIRQSHGLARKGIKNPLPRLKTRPYGAQQRRRQRTNGFVIFALI